MKKNGSKWSRNDESTQQREGEGEEREEHIKNTKSDSSAKSRRTQGGFETSFSLEILVLTQITRISGPLSHKHLRGGETLTRMKENANGGGEGYGDSLILFNRVITQSQFCPWIQLSQTT
jgi:hypothetical protein